MEKYTSESISFSTLEVFDENYNSTFTASASASATATAYNETDATIISNNLSSTLAIKNLNIESQSNSTAYNVDVKTSSTIKKTDTCNTIYNMACNEDYYEHLLTTWGERNPTEGKFLWGSATSAFQVEGSLDVDGRGPSIWDVFQDTPGKIADGSTAKIATNSYHQYKEDVEILLNMNCNCYRFSISWSRILPNGKGEINQAGIDYYNNLINELLNNKITPVITLYHWDLPQALELEYDGLLCKNKDFARDFANYADICFQNFGDRVKLWITFNEPQTVAVNAYEYPYFAPAKGTSDGISPNGLEYLAGHNQLLAHAYAVKVFRTKYSHTNGRIGIACNCDAAVPYSDSVEDFQAADRNFIFWFGWWYDTLSFGNYPDIMIELVGDRLPKFTSEEKELLQGSYDIMYMNTYTARYFKAQAFDPIESPGWRFDQQNITLTTNSEGCPIGPNSAASWLQITPYGPKILLNKIQERYGNGPKSGVQLKQKDGSYKSIPFIFSEFGLPLIGEGETTSYEIVKKDCTRIFYYESYFKNIKEGIDMTGINLIGILPWSLLDNFEWTSGYTQRFGINYVDFTSPSDYRPRKPKYSTLWYRDFIKSHPDGL